MRSLKIFFQNPARAKVYNFITVTLKISIE